MKYLFLLLCFSGGALFAQTAPAPDAVTAARITRVENGLLPPARIANSKPVSWSLVSRMAAHNVHGVSIALINGGMLEWVRGYSLAATNQLSPVTPDTRFQIDALSEPLIAFAALTLVQPGKLTLDTDVCDRLKPSVNSSLSASVTLRSLLTHAPRSPDNNNDVLRGLIAEICGIPFPTLMRDRVLRPMGMDSTVIGPVPSAIISTTPSDLAKFALAMQHALEGQQGPISRSNAEAMLAPQSSQSAWGLGLELKGAGQNASYHRSDNSEHSCAFLVSFPHIGQGAVVMTDSGDAALAGEILRAIAREYQWPDYQVIEKTTVALSPLAFEDFAGIYTRDDALIRILQDGGHYYLKPRGEPRMEIFPQSDHDFFLLDQPDILSFESNSLGVVTHIIRRTTPPQIFRRVR